MSTSASGHGTVPAHVNRYLRKSNCNKGHLTGGVDSNGRKSEITQPGTDALGMLQRAAENATVSERGNLLAEEDSLDSMDEFVRQGVLAHIKSKGSTDSKNRVAATSKSQATNTICTETSRQSRRDALAQDAMESVKRHLRKTRSQAVHSDLCKSPTSPDATPIIHCDYSPNKKDDQQHTNLNSKSSSDQPVHDIEREVAAIIIQTYWRRWLDWKLQVRKAAEAATLERLLKDGFNDDAGWQVPVALDVSIRPPGGRSMDVNFIEEATRILLGHASTPYNKDTHRQKQGRTNVQSAAQQSSGSPNQHLKEDMSAPGSHVSAAQSNWMHAATGSPALAKYSARKSAGHYSAKDLATNGYDDNVPSMQSTTQIPEPGANPNSLQHAVDADQQYMEQSASGDFTKADEVRKQDGQQQENQTSLCHTQPGVQDDCHTSSKLPHESARESSKNRKNNNNSTFDKTVQGAEDTEDCKSVKKSPTPRMKAIQELRARYGLNRSTSSPDKDNTATSRTAPANEPAVRIPANNKETTDLSKLAGANQSRTSACPTSPEQLSDNLLTGVVNPSGNLARELSPVLHTALHDLQKDLHHHSGSNHTVKRLPAEVTHLEQSVAQQSTPARPVGRVSRKSSGRSWQPLPPATPHLHAEQERMLATPETPSSPSGQLMIPARPACPLPQPQNLERPHTQISKLEHVIDKNSLPAPSGHLTRTDAHHPEGHQGKHHTTPHGSDHQDTTAQHISGLHTGSTCLQSQQHTIITFEVDSTPLLGSPTPCVEQCLSPPQTSGFQGSQCHTECLPVGMSTDKLSSILDYLDDADQQADAEAVHIAATSACSKQGEQLASTNTHQTQRSASRAASISGSSYRTQNAANQNDNASVSGSLDSASGASPGNKSTKLAESVFSNFKLKIRRLQGELRQRDTAIVGLHGQIETLQREHQADIDTTDLRLAEALAQQKREFEATIARHLGFIDRLLADKDELSRSCSALMDQVKALEEKQEKAVAGLKDNWATEMKRQKEAWAAAEKIKREQWMHSKTAEIKEVTIKGLEIEVQRLLGKHKAEIVRVQEQAAENAKRQEDMLRAQHEATLRQLRDKLLKEQEEAVDRERLSAQNRLRDASERYEQQLQAQRLRLVADQDLRMDQLDAQHREERRRLEENIARMTKEHEQREKEMLTDFQREKEAMRKAHEKHVEAVQDQLTTQQEGWKEAVLEKMRRDLSQKEDQMKQQMKAEQQEEIKVILERLEEEAEQEREQLAEKYRKKEESLVAKHNAAIKELKKSEVRLAEKFRQAAESGKSSQERAAAAEGHLSQYRQELEAKNERLKWFEDQLSKAKAKERRREEDIRGLASEKEAACNQKLSEAHAKIDTLRMQLSQAAKEKQDLKTKMDRDMEYLDRRVKATLAKKEEKIYELQDKLNVMERESKQTAAMLSEMDKDYQL